MKPFAPRLIIVLLSACALACLEWGARCRIEAAREPFHQSLRLLELDAELGWRQRRRLNTSFLGKPVATNSSGFRIASKGAARTSTRRVLILGPSSTFGWGVSFDETYAGVLGELLDKQTPGVSWQVVNGGQIGFSSWQGVRLLREVLADGARWDWIVFAYGVNDTDRHRFFDASKKPDHQALVRGPSAFRLRTLNRLNRSSLLRLLASAGHRVRSEFMCRWIAEGGPSAERVPRTEFIKNNRGLLSRARARGAKVLFLTTATAYPPPPEDPEKTFRAKVALRAGIALFRAHEYKGARAKLLESLAAAQSHSEARFWLSAVESQEKNCSAAREQFRRGRALERFRIAQEVSAYNKALIDLARQENVSYLDLARLTSGMNSADFVDPVHFSPAGHRKIAQGLLAAIASAPPPHL